MADSKRSTVKVDFNKKPLLVPVILIIGGGLLLFLGPDPIIQLIGGMLAFLGILVGFVLATVVLSFILPLKTKKKEKSSS
ncbi:MAG: hypothetical protein ACW976_02685 [Candidatus Ranarchaeia archaeon]